jgi:hypothetical protein
MLGRAVLGLLWIVLAMPTLSALTFPELTGRVVDEAGILDPSTKAALERKLSEFEGNTTGQLIVVTLKSLRGTSIEDYGYQLGRHWQIGQKEKNTGALLIVAPNERKVRIEVGYGFEGTLTDAVSKLIQLCLGCGQTTLRVVSGAESTTSSRRCLSIPRNGRRAPDNAPMASRRSSTCSLRCYYF